MSVAIIVGEIFEANGAWILARITGNDEQPITQASLSSISYRVWRVGKPNPAKGTKRGERVPMEGPSSLTIADVVFDTLVTNDARWTGGANDRTSGCALPARDIQCALGIGDVGRGVKVVG